MKSKRSIQLLAVIVFLIPLLAFAAMNWYTKKYCALPVLGPVDMEGRKLKDHVIQDFKLINQDGQIVSTGNWKDKIVVADFFFSHCPSICPAMTNNLKKVQETFRKNDGDILINSFTVDPLRDSATHLKSYSMRMQIDNSNWHFITGDKKEIYRLARNSFMIVATDGDGGPEDFIHSEKLVLIDRHKRIRGYYKGTSDSETEQLINDIKKLKDEN